MLKDEMNIKDCFRLGISLWPVRSDIVACLIGDPGIGKTQFVISFRDWVRENTQYKNCKIVEIITSQILPNEVSGLAMPNGRSKSMEIFDHKRLASLEDGDILFFDELLQGSPQVLSACLTLIQERRMMSGKKLPDIMIIAAANPTVSPGMIPAPVRDRFFFVPVKFDAVEWRDYITETRGVTPTQTLIKTIEKSLSSKEQVWNMFTPRDATKLIDWFLNKPIEITDSEWAWQVRTMYSDTLVADEIVKTCKSRQTQRTIVKILDEFHEFHGTSEAWKSSDKRKEIFITPENKLEEFIESFENSEELIKLLSQISYNKIEY